MNSELGSNSTHSGSSSLSVSEHKKSFMVSLRKSNISSLMDDRRRRIMVKDQSIKLQTSDGSNYDWVEKDKEVLFF